jgi:hypothetical protein
MIRRALGYGCIVLALPLVLVATLFPKSLFYRNRRPTSFGKWTNDVMALWYSTRTTPSLMSTLEVARRHSGGTQRVPIVIARVDGEEYLVSMLGEGSEWSKNVIAASGQAVIQHGKARKVQLETVPVERRAPVLKAYVTRAIGARPHIHVSPNAPLSEFARIAAEYPVYRIAPAVPAN